MKVRITQRQVYHKIAVVEIEIDNDAYEHYKIDNGKYATLDDYLQENEDLWVDEIDNKINESEFIFGIGMDSGDWTDIDQDSELRYDCEELKIGGHL